MWAIAEFGSHSRNEQDESSDQDLLVVCDFTERKFISEKYAELGFSVSTYTPSQLRHMRDKGSLFLQHIKTESIIVYDKNGDFKSFLNTCRLVHPPRLELERCEAAINYAFSWPNHSPILCWKVDFLYCLIRDYLIKILASNGILAFGIPQIEQELCNLKSFSRKDFGGLSAARQIKSSFRDNQFVDNARSLEALNSLWGLTRKLTAKIESSSPKPPSELCIDSLDEKLPNYVRLRTLEATHLLLRDHGTGSETIGRVRQLTRQPNLYGSSSDRKQKEIISHILNVLPLVDDAMENDSIRAYSAPAFG